MIPIKKIKKVREDLNMTHVVIFGIDENGAHHVCTHGKTQLQAKQAAEAGNSLKKGMNWPEDMCDSKPLKRICEKCSFWKIDEHDNRNRIPDRWPGHCYLNPVPVKRFLDDIACISFEPNC